MLLRAAGSQEDQKKAQPKGWALEPVVIHTE